MLTFNLPEMFNSSSLVSLERGQRHRDVPVFFTTVDLVLKKLLVPSGHLTTIVIVE